MFGENIKVQVNGTYDLLDLVREEFPDDFVNQLRFKLAEALARDLVFDAVQQIKDDPKWDECVSVAKEEVFKLAERVKEVILSANKLGLEVGER